MTTTARERLKQFKARQKAGVQAVAQPWHWLSLDRLRDLTRKAYQAATWSSRLQLSEGEDYTEQELREFFTRALVEQFEAYLMAEAYRVAGCWPTGAHASACADFVEAQAAQVPKDWRPQYPAYKKLTPASACNASGAVTTVDEGNRDASNSTAF